MLYKRCAELPLAIFIKIILEDNINYLVKEGQHPAAEIQAVWEALYSEYFELSGSVDCKHMINTAKALLIAENKIEVINACVSILRYKHNDQLYQALEAIGYPLKRIDDPQERWQAIERLVSRAKGLLHSIASHNRELERLNGTNRKPTEQDYIDTITHLSKYQGYRIDPDSTSVAEYLSIQRNYRRTVENGK